MDRHRFGICVALLGVLILGLSTHAVASAPSVSVSLGGPDEGAVNTNLTFTANGSYSLDDATRAEIAIPTQPLKVGPGP